MAVVESSTIPGVSTTVEFWCEGVGKDSGDLHFSTLVKKKKKPEQNNSETGPFRTFSPSSMCVYAYLASSASYITCCLSFSAVMGG